MNTLHDQRTLMNHQQQHENPVGWPWHEVGDLAKFRGAEWRTRLLSGLPIPHQLLREKSQPVVNRLKGVAEELERQLVGKGRIIRMILVAAIAQQPMLLVGPPGTAKSRIITRFCELLGIGRVDTRRGSETCFQYLLHSFTEPDEILGLVDLQALKGERDGKRSRPRFRRLRRGSITDADVIFLDEVFKANSAILNSLLTLINERRVYEGGVSLRTRARLIFGACNEPPSARQMEELRAFYSRFIIRMRSEPVDARIEDDGGPSEERRELLRRGWKSEVRDLRAGYDPQAAALESIACLNDILFCNRAVTELWGGDDLGNSEIKEFVDHYHRLVAVLPEGLIDDRKFIRLFLVARAHALFPENRTPTLDDLCVLQHAWDGLNEEELLAQTVTKYIQQKKADHAAR